MDALLRRYVEWRGRTKAAQVIVFDGGAEVEKTRYFLRGILSGIALSFLVLSLAAPGSVDPDLLEEADRRATLVREANARTEQAAKIADLCLNTARRMDQTLTEYRKTLGQH